MAIHTIPFVKEKWRIYAIVCEYGDQEFVVKIGVTSTPYERYMHLLCGIPFHSVMLHSLVGFKKRAYGLESLLHKLFTDRHTRGEWFKFKLAHKAEFHKTIADSYALVTKQALKWEKITPEQVSPHVTAIKAFKQKYGRKKRDVEWRQYRHG